MITDLDIEQIEIDVILHAVHRRYGYDFRSYAASSLKRRFHRTLSDAGLTHVSEMLPLLPHDQGFFDMFLKNLSVTVTEMFRDPEFYAAVRKQIIPILKTHPFIKIWHAGCATGEEAYSMAILLHEEGLLDRTMLYATDHNKMSIGIVKEGIYSVNRIQKYTSNYVACGGTGSFSDYYDARYDAAKMKSSLSERITFCRHNLVTDGVFGEMNLVVCRNVLIYFNQALQNRVLALFAESLRDGGFLCLGTKESIRFSNAEDLFEPEVGRLRIFKRRVEAMAPGGEMSG